jgi:hypothetical protein
MERSISTYESILGRPCSITAPGHHDVAVLGQSPAPRQPAICSEIAAPPFRPRGRVTVANVMQLLEHQEYRCALTGRKLTPDTASLDHIVPVRCGGAHLVENTQVLHKDVNRAKTTMTSEEFIQLCREVVAHIDGTHPSNTSLS